MSISIVNGFVCTSSCDVAKAKKGEDPHPLTGAAKIAAEKGESANDPTKVDPLSTHDPAVVFGGALANLHAVPPVDARALANPANPRSVGAAVDLSV
jgi:hypothetical protein